MSRDFSRGTDVINLGDVTGARFDADVAWSLFAVYRINNSSVDDNAIVSKYESGGAQQFILRTASGTAPTELEVFLGVNQEISGNSGVIELDTWYCALVTSNGDGGFPNDNFLYNAELDGTFTDDGIANTNWGNAGDLTADILIGARAGGSDHMDGLVSLVFYIDGEATRAEFLAFLSDPFPMIAYFKEKYGLQILHALEGNDSPEPDWSGNGNDGTVTGTVKGENPPMRWFGPRTPAIGITAGVGGNTETLAAVATGVATLNRSLSAERSLAATATGIAAIARLASFFRDLSAIATGVADVSEVSSTGQHSETIAAVATGIATVSRRLLLERTLSGTATGSAAITLALQVSRTLEALATGVAGVERTLSLFKALTATATGVAAMAAGRLFEVTLSAIATVVATLTAAFTEAPEEPGVPFSGHAGIQRRSRWKLRRPKWKPRR